MGTKRDSCQKHGCILLKSPIHSPTNVRGLPNHRHMQDWSRGVWKISVISNEESKSKASFSKIALCQDRVKP